MDCKYFKDLLSTYIDGYLKEEEKNSLEKHLSYCKSCNDYLNKLKNYKENFKNFEKIEAPLGFEKKVMEKIEKKEENKIFLFNKKFIFEFSAVLVVLISVFLVYLNLNKKEELQKIIFEEKVLKEEKIPQPSKDESQKIEKIKAREEVFKEKSMDKEKNKMDLIGGEKKEKTSKLSIEQSKKAEMEEISKSTPKREESINESQKIYRTEKKKEEGKEVKEQISFTESTKVPKMKEAEKVPLETTFKEAPVADFTQTGYNLENKLKIKISYEKFDEIFKKVEEILKEENIKYEKNEIKGKNVEIIMHFENLQKFLNKIKEIEGIEIGDTGSLKEEDKIKIEFSSF